MVRQSHRNLMRLVNDVIHISWHDVTRKKGDRIPTPQHQSPTKRWNLCVPLRLICLKSFFVT